MSEQSRRCMQVKADGERCRAWAIDGSDKCWAHADELAQKRAEARRKGGRARSVGDVGSPGEVTSPADVLEGLSKTIRATWKQKNTAARTRALVGAYRAALSALEAIADRGGLTKVGRR